jgi:hypothetical protein
MRSDQDDFPPVPKDEALLHAACARLDKAIVNVMSADLATDKFERLEIGTGVLVRLGGQELLFTAAHNVMADGKPVLEKWITVTGIHNLPNGLQVVMRPGGGTTRVSLGGIPGASGLVEPDVAVLDLGPNALLRSDRLPFTAEEIGFIPPDTVALAVVAGFPAASAKAIPTSPVIREAGPLQDITGEWLVAPVMLTTGKRHANEPPAGRGLHLPWGGFGLDAKGKRKPFPHPEGLSGGPVLTLDANGMRLVGLVRCRDEDDLWCEPALAAVHAVAAHPNPAIASAACDLLARFPAHSPSSAR